VTTTVKFSDKGSGWHKEGTRHSRAKKFGTAGGQYHVPTRSKKLRKLTYSQLKKKGVKLSANGDADHDGVKNRRDCRPFNPKKQDYGFDDDSWESKSIKELAVDQKGEVKEAKDRDGDYVNVEMDDGREYMVFENYDDAERYAIERVKEDLDDDPSMFTQDWLQQFITISDTDKRIMASEEADNQIENMDDDDILRRANVSDEYDGEEDDDKKEKILEEAKDSVREEIEKEWEDGLEDPVSFLCDDQGLYSREELLKQNFVFIDTDEASKDAVNTDGVAHFLARYDGDQIELPGGAVAYRTN